MGKVLSESCGKVALSPKALEAEINSIIATNPKAFNISECETSFHETDTEVDCKIAPPPMPDLLIPMRQTIISSSEDEESDNNVKSENAKVKEPVAVKKYDFSSFMSNK